MLRPSTFLALLPALLGSLLLAPPALEAASDTSWSSVPIGGGGFVSGITFHPTEKNLAYCRTDVGGAYRWDAPNNAWIALNDDLGQADSQLLGVTGIALDPRDPNKVYLATGQYLQTWGHLGAVLRSSDRGATWSRTNLTIRLGGNADGRSGDERLIVDPNLGSTLFLASDTSGLWKSTDSGASFTKLTSFPSAGVSVIIAAPASGTAGSATPTLYAGGYSVSSTQDQWGNLTSFTYSAPALLRSLDGGASWSPLPGAPSGRFWSHAAIDANGLLYLTLINNLGPNGASSGAVYTFNPASSVWTNITPTNESGSWGFSGLSLDRSHPGTLIVSTLDRWWPGHDEIYRSTDGGASWKGILNGAPRTHDTAPWAAASTPHWVSDVEIDPSDSDRIFFNTGYGLLATTQATRANTGPGTSVPWTFYNVGLEETVPLALVSPTAGAPLVSAIGDIGGFRHDSLTTTPAARHTASSPLGTCESVDVAELAPQKLVLIGYGSSQAGFLSTNGGSTWTQFPTRPSYASGDAGRIALNADGTRILWSPKSQVPQLSTDNGATWTASTGAVALSGSPLATVTDKVNPLRAYAYNSSNARLYASTDGGSSWSAVNTTTLPTGSSYLRATPGNEGHLWLSSWSNGLYHSTDGGATWSRLSTVTKGYKLGLGAPAPAASYPTLYLWGIIGDVEGIHRSTDQGATWTRIDDNQHRYGWLNDIVGDSRTYGRVYLATGGRGIVTGELATPPVFTVQPATQAAAAGSTVLLSAAATGASTWQWYRNGTALTGETAATLTLTNFNGSKTGDYTVLALTASGASTLSTAATLTLASPIENRLVNISTRGPVGLTSQPMIGGFYIQGTQHKTVLIRAAGPCLRGAPFGISDGLEDPVLTLYRDQTVLATNDNWADSDPASIEAAAARTGAFMVNWTRGSKDSALLITLPPGGYTAQLSSKIGGATGNAMVEIYDADEFPTASQLVNISTQSDASDTQTPIAGFYVHGPARRVLVRAGGPALGKFGVTPILANPSVTLRSAATGESLASNDNWGADIAQRATLRAAFASTGAFDLINGVNIWEDASTDAAFVTTLQPSGNGNTGFTATVSGDSAAVGRTIVEVYDYP